MSLKFTHLEKEGDINKEYVVLQATATVNINGYAVVDRTYNSNGKISNIHRHFFRFPDRTIREGEYVRLRSGEGNYHLEARTDKHIVHVYYWGSETPIWNDDEIEKAELLKVSTIATISA